MGSIIKTGIAGIALLAAFFGAPQPGQSQESAHRIVRTETLDIIVIGRDDLTMEVTVDGAGRIRMPLVGSIRAAGMTIEGLQTLITRKLAARDVDDPLVMVDLLLNRLFTITGQVKHPGEYFHTAGMTIRMAVEIAGGFTNSANTDLMLLTRAAVDSQPPLEVRLSERVRPGDAIEIERRLD